MKIQNENESAAKGIENDDIDLKRYIRKVL